MKAQQTPIVGAKERLIEAAGEIFGEQGFHGSTVREITKRAGVNLAAINYYFRDKEELYWEVLQHAVRASMRYDKIPEEDLPGEEQLGLFVAEMLRNMLDPTRPDWHGKLISREMAAPTRLLDMVVESTIRPKTANLRKILRKIWGGPLGEKQEFFMSASIMGQCIHYRQNRAVLERLNAELYKGKDAIDRISKHITAFSVAALRNLKEAASATV